MVLACLCLHGFGENKEIYSNFIKEMSKLMPTKAVDLLGHGEALSTEYKIGDVLDRVAATIENMSSDVILVGTSFGGIVSYILSSQNQTKYARVRDKIKGIVINDVPCCIPKVSFTNLANNLSALTKNTHKNLDELNHAYNKNGFKLDRIPVSDQHWKDFLAASLWNGKVKYDIKFIETILSADAGISKIADGVLFNKMPDGSEALDLRHYYNAITKPILLFIGERTTFFPQHVHDFIAEHKTTEKHIIANGGHFLDLARDDIMAYIEAWLLNKF